MRNMRFKVGDRVRIKSLDWYNEKKTIHGDIWFDNAVFVGGQSLYCGCELTIRLVTDDSYYVIENDYYWTDEMIEGLVEELLDNDVKEHQKICDEVLTIQGIEPIEAEIEQIIHCPEGYIFKDENGNVINAQKIVLEKKKKEYPKTYEECCEIVKVGKEHTLEGTTIRINYKIALLESFQKVLICRDAYWKIAGEEMGLGKPWKPDWKNDEQFKYIIICRRGCIIKDTYTAKDVILAFPTEEMRDAFYENFKELINECKELL